ncbi:hypothetical protein D9758_005167 [Tetrapyrgos nigripes]|uniref:Uncharacterized protein n=1 Tax=Tetrapyrgos nigripes TaxID=182062 RepID=A0A8H5LWW9_9AGAR|nr:hypothetical protein D9758_005167 [Tetrapyrgos nigripes]
MSTRALSCHDILEQIIRLLIRREVDENDNIIIHKQDVLTCALTCRSFLGPALSTLWYSLNSLVPLLKLLPNFKTQGDYYCLTGRIEEKDWSNFDSHAELVREFIYTDVDSPDHIVLPSVYLRLAQCRPKPLPHLMRFNCPCSTAAITETLLFLSPLLEKVEFKNVCSVAKRTNVEMFLSFLADESVQSLRSLYMDGNITKGLLSAICHFKHLRSLELIGGGTGSDNDLYEEDLVQVGTALENLTKFSLEANLSPKPPASLSENPAKGPKFTAFANLTDLTLTGTPASITRVLQAITSDCIQKLEFHIPESTDSEQPHIQYIIFQAGSRWATTITSLKFYLTNANGNESRGWGDDFSSSSDGDDNDSSGGKEDLSMGQFLRAIYQHQWPLLEVLTIDRAIGWACSDKDVSDLVSMWSKLRELELSLNPPKHSQLPTILSLYTIAQGLPHLTSLRISLNLRYLPKDMTVTQVQSPTAFTPHRLHHLFIDSDHAGNDIVLLVHHLDTVFPYLHTLLGRRNAQSDWSEIQSILRLCQKVRASERRRMKAPAATFG